MTVHDRLETRLDQGTPNAAARWLHATTDPMTHLERYVDRPAIAFEFGADDRHVPHQNAEAFAGAVAALGSVAPSRITRHPGLDHLTSGRDEEVLQRCVNWLSDEVRVSAC